MTQEHDPDAILAECLKRIDAGEKVDSVCADHPEIADELRSYLDGDALIEKLREEDVDDQKAKVDTSNAAFDETLKPGVGQETDRDLLGKMFGRYKLLRQLGQGAMGAVYLARDTNLDRDVALKIPTISLTDRDDFTQRFKLEAQSAASLKHQNICPVYDFGEIDGTPFITMTFINGFPLSRLVVKDNQDQSEIAEIVRTLADALSHAHELGVVHRDLKPGNILIEENGTPHITDFGLACRVDRVDQSRLTQEGAILGTPLYMAPEQVEGQTGKIGPCTDIYALGVILYELLTGETPFRGTIASIFAQIIRDDPKSPIEINRFADKTLSRLCLKMMSKRPEERPKSMDAVIAELDEVFSLPVAKDDNKVNSKTERSVKKFDAAKAKINDLVKRGQYAQAVKLLEKLAAVTAPEAVGHASWARAELPLVKAIPKQKRSNLPAVVATASELVNRYDYGQAAEMLQQIPSSIRNAEANQLLDEAIDLQDEVELLLADLQGCVRRKEYEGIEDNLKRLLEIKPGNRFAKDLWESLQTYSNIPVKSRKYNFDNQGHLLPKEDDFNSAMIAVIATAFIAFGIAFAGITFYLKNDQFTVAVTFDEELLKNGNLTLTFDGKDYVIDGPEFNLKVAAGEYGYEVRQGNTMIVNPERFTVAKDGKNILEITANRRKREVDNPMVEKDERNGLKNESLSQAVGIIEIEQLIYFEEHAERVSPILEFSRDSRLLYTCYGDYSGPEWTISLKEFQVGGSAQPVTHDIKPASFNISQDSHTMAVGRHAGKLELYRTSDRKLLNSFQSSDKRGQFGTVKISPDGRYIGGACVLGTANVWKIETGELIKEFEFESGNAFATSVDFTPDSSRFILVSQGDDPRKIYSLNIEDRNLTEHPVAGGEGTGTMTVINNNQIILGNWYSRALRVVELSTWSISRSFGTAERGNAITSSADGSYVVAAAKWDESNQVWNEIRIYDTKTFKQIRSLKLNFPCSIQRIAFSPNGKYLASTGQRKNESEKNIFCMSLWEFNPGLQPDGKLSKVAEDYLLR